MIETKIFSLIIKSHFLFIDLMNLGFTRSRSRREMCRLASTERPGCVRQQGQPTTIKIMGSQAGLKRIRIKIIMTTYVVLLTLC